jgi:hypothetical protein
MSLRALRCFGHAFRVDQSPNYLLVMYETYIQQAVEEVFTSVGISGEDTNNIRLAHTQITLSVARFLQDMKLLQELYERIFTTWCAIDRYHQEKSIQMVKGGARSV